MQLCEYITINKIIQLCVIDIFSKNACVISLKDKKAITITDVFKKSLMSIIAKPNNIWIDKVTGFCDKLMKSWVHNNDIELYLTQNKGKSIVLNLKLMIM